MHKTRYYPLICFDRENGDMMPLFCTESKRMMEEHHKLYLSEMVPRYYKLNANIPLTRDVWQTFNVHCPLCEDTMNRISTPTDRSGLPLYRCPRCNRKE